MLLIKHGAKPQFTMSHNGPHCTLGDGSQSNINQICPIWTSFAWSQQFCIYIFSVWIFWHFSLQKQCIPNCLSPQGAALVTCCTLCPRFPCCWLDTDLYFCFSTSSRTRWPRCWPSWPCSCSWGWSAPRSWARQRNSGRSSPATHQLEGERWSENSINLISPLISYPCSDFNTPSEWQHRGEAFIERRQS